MAGKKNYGWVIVGVVFLLTFVYQIQYTFGIFLEPMVNQFGWSRASISGVYSMGLLVLIPGGLLWGIILDKHSPRILFAVSCALGGLGLFLSSFVSQLWQFYITFGLIWGIGWSSLFITSTTLVRKWFTARAGMAMGIAVSGISIGWVIIMPMTGHFITTLGWQDTFRFLGFLVWIVGIIAGILLKRPPEDEKSITLEENGSPVYIVEDWEIGEAVGSYSFRMMWLTMFLILTVIFVVTSHGIAFISELGISETIIARVFGIMGLISIIGRLGSGWYVDYLVDKGMHPVDSRKYMLSLSGAIMGVSVILLIMVTGPVQLWFWTLIFGVGYGIHVPQLTTIMGDMFGRKNLGLLTALVGTAGGVAGIIGPVFTGAVYDSTGSYITAFRLLILVSFLAAIVPLFIRVPKKKVLEAANSKA